MWARLVLLVVGVSSIDVVSHLEPIRARLDTLQFVHVIWRHGDRTPAELISDDDEHARKWPQGLGELTRQGAGQQYRLGKWLRQRYGDWLSPKFDPNSVYIRSSDFNRTLMSAAANMAGLFPPASGEGLDQNLNWQPVPVHTVPKFIDKQLYDELKCPTAERELNMTWKSEKAKELERKYATLLSLLAAKSERPSIPLKDVWVFFDNYFCEMRNNITWPSWLTEATFDELTDLYDAVSQFEFHTETLKRLRGGPLLKEIVHRFLEKINGKLGEKPKFFAYSAHDTTIAATLATLGIFPKVFPLYATALIFEMHKAENGSMIIEILHKNQTDVDSLYSYALPGCQPCTIQAFNEKMKPYFPADWETECELKEEKRNSSQDLYIVAILVLSFTTLLFGCLLLIEKQAKRHQRQALIREVSGDDQQLLLNEEGI